MYGTARGASFVFKAGRGAERLAGLFGGEGPSLSPRNGGNVLVFFPPLGLDGGNDGLLCVDTRNTSSQLHHAHHAREMVLVWLEFRVVKRYIS